MDWSNCGEYLALISFYLYSVTGLKMDWSNCGEYQALILFLLIFCYRFKDGLI